MKKITLLFVFALLNIAVFSQPVADFMMSSNKVCTLGDSISFTDASTGSAPMIWLWSVTPSTGASITNNIAQNTNITFTASGIYTVQLIFTDVSGSDTVSKLVTVYGSTPVTPSICMVTCDGASVNNIVYWDKTPYSNVDSFIVYRETSPGMYSKIAAVPVDSMSQYIDTSRSVGPANGDPNLASYRYKIQIRDSCGNFSAMSPYHNTIYIIDAGSGQFDWSIPYSIEGAANPVTNYVLLCDTAGVNVWGPVASVSSSSSSAIDPGFASHSAVANWRVKTAWSISCTPTRAAINTTRSNIKHAALTTGISSTINSLVRIYPNPANGHVTIELPETMKTAKIKIINLLGQDVFVDQNNVATTTGNIDISGLAKGIYTISIEAGSVKVFKKLIVN